jgi:hypothetical protein
LTAALSRDQHFRPQQISFTDSRLIDLPKSQKASDIAMFAGNCTCRVTLPAYRQHSTA